MVALSPRLRSVGRSRSPIIDYVEVESGRLLLSSSHVWALVTRSFEPRSGLSQYAGRTRRCRRTVAHLPHVAVSTLGTPIYTMVKGVGRRPSDPPRPQGGRPRGARARRVTEQVVPLNREVQLMTAPNEFSPATRCTGARRRGRSSPQGQRRLPAHCPYVRSPHSDCFPRRSIRSTDR